MFHTTKPKTMSPLCTIAITTLSVVGGLTLVMLCKKKCGNMMKQMKKTGCECMEKMGDAMDFSTPCDTE